MPNLDEIREQIIEVNKGNLADFVSLVKYLPEILSEDEHIEKILEGSLNDNIVLMVATNQRLVFVASTIFGKDLRTAGLPYDKIHLITGNVQKTFWSGTQGSLRILDSEHKETLINEVFRYDVEDFALHIQKKLEKIS